MAKKPILLACMLALGLNVHAQDTLSFFEPAPSPDASRLRIVGYSVGGTYALSMAGLYSLWYKDYDPGPLHFFDDGGEWLQFDKAGHFGSAYYLGKWSNGIYRWAGLAPRRSAWLGGLTGMAFMTSIEMFDGWSSEWGFSWSDMAFNTAGTALMVGQQLAWQEQRIQVKFSHHATDYPRYRPDQLGASYPARLFKDYNGSTIWLSANIRSFIIRPPRGLPRWLSLSAGYGVEGLTGARTNAVVSDEGPVPEFERYRQVYLSLDVDLSRIETRIPWLNAVLDLFGFVKFPAPALELNEPDGARFHWIYF